MTFNRKNIAWLLILALLVTLVFSGCSSRNSEEEALLDSYTGSVGSTIGNDQNDGGADSDSSGDTQAPQQSTPSENSGNQAQTNNNTNNNGANNNQTNNNTSNTPNNNAGNNNQQQAGQNTPADEGEEEDSPFAAMINDESGTKIKLMNQNLRTDAKADQGTNNDARLRRYRLQELIKKYDPDIIACQEADPFWLETLEADYGSKYGMYYKQRGIIEGLSTSDEASPVLWKKDKYEKLGEGYFWLSKTPGECSVSYEEGQLSRICNWVRLKDKATGAKFVIYSTHFGFYKENSSIDGLRNQFAAELNKLPKDTYGFVMGDFNFYAYQEQYYIFADETNITDLRNVAEAMQGDGHCEVGDLKKGSHNGFKDADGNAFIDYVMAAPRKKMAVDSYNIIFDQPDSEKGGQGFVSDHFAVLVEVRIDTRVSYEEYYGATAK